jgi:hypothetical protein
MQWRQPVDVAAAVPAPFGQQHYRIDKVPGRPPADQQSRTGPPRVGGSVGMQGADEHLRRRRVSRASK